MAPRARVILASYNQVPYLRLVLRGYLRQTHRDFTLVVADDGSGPEQRAFLGEMAPLLQDAGIDFEHVWHEDCGWRKNRIMNEAVRRAKGEELLIFSDADCIPPAHFVERHLAVYEPRSFHVAGALRLSREESEGIDEASVDDGSFETLGSESTRHKLRVKARKSRWGTLLRRRHRPKVRGLNMGIAREIFEAVNGFDERFENPYLGEDTDLRDRLMRLRPRPRVKVLYTENDVYHLWHSMGTRSPALNRPYYSQKRPVRCAAGLVPLDPEESGAR